MKQRNAIIEKLERQLPAPIHQGRAFLPEGTGLFREAIPGGELYTREQIEEWGAGNDHRIAIFYQFGKTGEV